MSWGTVGSTWSLPTLGAHVSKQFDMELFFWRIDRILRDAPTSFAAGENHSG